MQVNGPFIYFTIPILGGIPITQTAVSSFIVMLVLCIAGYFLGRNLKKRPGSMQVIVEKLVTMLYNLVEGAMGKHNSHWTPYIGALFLSSILGSLIGMTGFLRSSTADLSTTVVWALMTSVLVWRGNIRSQGLWNWLKGFAEPFIVMLPMNIISEIAQPVSMAFRHFGNIMGGGVLTSLIYFALSTASSALLGLVGSNIIVSLVVLALGIFLFVRALQKKTLVGKIFGVFFIVTGVLASLESLGILSGVPYLQVGIPAVLSVYFDLFSGFLQALIFSLLTMVYIGSACPPPEETSSQQ